MSRYYLFLGSEVAGPYEAAELASQVTPGLQVCPEETGAWVGVENIPELAVFLSPMLAQPPIPTEPPAAGAGIGAPAHLAPHLQELWKIARDSSNEEILAERKKHWGKYHLEERKIIENELARRGLN